VYKVVLVKPVIHLAVARVSLSAGLHIFVLGRFGSGCDGRMDEFP
jgi:hypothetical protein